eukprot:7434436-Heterocapsa_arctica.AAC.1
MHAVNVVGSLRSCLAPLLLQPAVRFGCVRRAALAQKICTRKNLIHLADALLLSTEVGAKHFSRTKSASHPVAPPASKSGQAWQGLRGSQAVPQPASAGKGGLGAPRDTSC